MNRSWNRNGPIEVPGGIQASEGHKGVLYGRPATQAPAVEACSNVPPQKKRKTEESSLDFSDPINNQKDTEADNSSSSDADSDVIEVVSSPGKQTERNNQGTNLLNNQQIQQPTSTWFVGLGRSQPTVIKQGLCSLPYDSAIPGSQDGIPPVHLSFKTSL